MTTNSPDADTTAPATAITTTGRLRRFIVRTLGTLALAYVALLVTMSMLERWLVYPAPPADRSSWTPSGFDHLDVWLTAEDGVKTHGRYYRLDGAERAVLYCHGNGECVTDNHNLMVFLRDKLQASVLIFDYRGYGHSEGKPNEQGVLADARAAQNWLAKKTERKPNEVILIGRSLGGGVAVDLAAEQGASALVLQSTFTRLTDAAASSYPFLPVHWLMRNRYDSIEKIVRYEGPTIISHGSADQVIPPKQAETLYHASPSPRKRLINLGPRGHNAAQPTEYYTELLGFFEECGV